MTDPQKQKLRLDYPCPWTYKIIGVDQDKMQNAVHEIVRDRPCRVSLSRRSETAKYVCLNIELTVESESHRLVLYEKLKAHPDVQVIL
jgi:putative lipoic acid-binding regulatory protein